MAAGKLHSMPKTRNFWILCAFLALAFITGGSSRSEVQSLLILRPISVLMCFYAAWNLRAEDLRNHKFLIGFAAACFALAIVHIIPLPPAIWHMLPGRELIMQIDQEAGLGEVWRPITMDLVGGWNALYSLFVPLAVLLLGINLKREELYRLLPVFIAIGIITGLVGLIQSASGTQSAVNMYSVSNTGSAVGLFANRNHQAVYLAAMFPMIAVYACTDVKTADQARIKLWVSVAIGLVLIPLLLATGSRAGIIAGLLGLLSTPILYNVPSSLVAAKRKNTKRRYYYIVGAFAALGVGLLSILFSRAEAVDRLFASNIGDDERAKIFMSAAQMAWSYFPFGSGMGSFTPVFKIGETYATLSPGYVNRAHNDYLELYMTGGLPAMLLLGAVFAALTYSAWKIWQSRKENSQSKLIARAALVVCGLFILASASDYPLRMPSLMCFAAVLGLWLNNLGRPDSLRS